jgi:hypothetical protein
MNEEAEKRIAAQLAKAMAMLCVRNSRLEDLHAGIVPATKTGDWSDVIVLDADGNRIPWRDVSRIDDEEMRSLMRDVVNRLYTFQLHAGNPALQAEIEKWMSVARKWDQPEVDLRMIVADDRNIRGSRNEQN